MTESKSSGGETIIEGEKCTIPLCAPESKPLGGKIITTPFLVFAALAVIAFLLLIKRFIYGLGSVTSLSDGYPWGIWIAYDVVTGTAIACGGYAMALLVYIFNKREYYPLVRPALMAAMFGYTLAGISIFFDVGRYWQAYNLFLPRFSQLNSVMFEVALCVTLYIFILWIEFSPSFMEWLKAKGLLKTANKLMFIFIAIGVLLPTMHQSSLGTLMVIAGRKVSPLWQSGLIPLFALISALIMGYAIVIFESIISTMALNREMETPILSKLSALMPWLLGVYLIIRFADVILKGQIGLVFNSGLKGVMFIVENILFILPLIFLSSAQNRTRPKMLFISAILMLLAGALYRFDLFLVAFDPGSGWRYFPAFSEIMITVGIISAEILGYMIFVKKLPVLPDLRHA
jgi:Ni/Fe-hydrogenase subunit HybB-like protein